MSKQDEQPLSWVLRESIKNSGLSFNRLEKETGVLRQSLMKFARGEQTLRGDVMERLVVFFELELKLKKGRKHGKHR
jgi:hypothetical protein